MNKRKKTRETYEKVASLWKEYKSKPVEELDLKLKDVKDSVVLDIGSGTGRYLKSFHSSNKVVELDYSFEMLKLNPGKLKVLSDIILLPFKDESFDFVLGIAILHHLQPNELKKALSQIKRVMKKNSKALFTFWYDKELSGKYVNVPWKKEGVINPRYYYFYSIDELKDIFLYMNFFLDDVYMDKKGRNIIVEVKK